MWQQRQILKGYNLQPKNASSHQMLGRGQKEFFPRSFGMELTHHLDLSLPTLRTQRRNFIGFSHHIHCHLLWLAQAITHHHLGGP